MAQIFRRPPSATATQERPKAKPANTGSGGSTSNGAVARFRTNIDNVISELRKVTWPTREETRNLTIVVIGISAVLGLLLGGIDQLLFAVYNLINH